MAKVEVQGFGLGWGVVMVIKWMRRSRRRGRVGKLEMKTLNVRLRRWALLRSAPGDPWHSVSERVTS